MRSSSMGLLKCHFLCAVVAGSLTTGADLKAQQLGAGGVLKENLDLPYDAVGDSKDEDEIASEIVVLYGQAFEGDGFVFLGEGST